MAENNSQSELGFASVWSLATGGMVGGGIYTALGVIVAISIQWSWLSFLIAGLIAFTSAYSYVKLATHFEESGGAFEYLREVNRKGLAGGLSWMLIIGYVLTIALYAFAFGHYIAYGFGMDTLTTRALAIGIVAAIIGLNLMGVGKLASVEIFIVWTNLAALLLLGIYGLFHFDSIQLMAGTEPRAWWSAPIGAAATFVSYEGFQLLTYDYDEIKKPEKILTPAILSDVAFVIVIYIIVTIGAVSLAGALTTITQKQVALAVAAEQALGLPGLILLVTAAAFATAAAINSTLFSTANLAKRIAKDGEFPKWMEHQNSNNVPDRAIILIGIFAAILAVTGSLSTLVEAASLVFLFTFGTVNYLAYRHINAQAWVSMTGLLLSGFIMIFLFSRLIFLAPVALSIIAFLSFVVIFVRPTILQNVKTDGDQDDEQ
ncbi:MAG TPA: APC family permease [Fodinibius sp.]|nr:APC family permease [Fodinibius sp.]